MALSASACGARSTLPGDSTASPSGAGAGGGSGGSTQSSGGSGGDPGPPVCHLSVADPPAIPLLSFPEGDADTPALVVLDPGDAASSHPAKLGTMAISEDANFWHPELRIAGLTVGTDWPKGVLVDPPPVLAGIDAHAWGKLAPGAGGGMALLWYRGDEAAGKQPGIKFRPFDTAKWQGGEEVFVDKDGDLPHALHPGKADGTPSGPDGYVASWSTLVAVSGVEPHVAVLDAKGAITIGPYAVAGADPSPKTYADVVWTGTDHLVGVGTMVCPDIGPPCKPASMEVLRIVPPSADTPGGVELVSAVPLVNPEAEPRRPSFAKVGEALWLAWSEKDPGDEIAPRRLRMVRLDAQGNLAGEPQTLAEGIVPAAALSVASTPTEMFLAWGEIANPDGDPGAVGTGRLHVMHFDADGAPIDPPLSVDTTAFAYNPAISLAPILHPWGVAVSWAAYQDDSRTITYLSRLDCAPP